MPLNFSAAHSSRITKRNKNPLLKRSLSSPFAGHARRKPLQRSHSKPETSLDLDDDLFEDRLSDLGLVNTLASDLILRDVAQSLRYIRHRMFSELPEKGGLNSTRISEVLNYRKALPPIVTLAQIHAFLDSPTNTEREIAELVKGGAIRKIFIPGRGVGGAAMGEGLVLAEDWERIVHAASELDEDMKNKFVTLLQSYPAALSFPRSIFSSIEASDLMKAGFLTSSSNPWTSINTFSRPGEASISTLASLSAAGSRSASGSIAAAGGEGAVHEAGGGGCGIRRASSHLVVWEEDGTRESVEDGGEFHLSLPTTGPYLRLLASTRAHLMSLLSKSKYREAPLDLLRERWDGGIAADDPASKARRARGEFAGVLPGRTRKWKQYYGLNFEWVLAECLGAGLVEVFETGSVGKACPYIRERVTKAWQYSLAAFSLVLQSHLLHRSCFVVPARLIPASDMEPLQDTTAESDLGLSSIDETQFQDFDPSTVKLDHLDGKLQRRHRKGHSSERRKKDKGAKKRKRARDKHQSLISPAQFDFGAASFAVVVIINHPSILSVAAQNENFHWGIRNSCVDATGSPTSIQGALVLRRPLKPLFGFLDLPPELRNQVYAHWQHNNTSFVEKDDEEWHSYHTNVIYPPSPSLLRAHNTMATEAKETYESILYWNPIIYLTTAQLYDFLQEATLNERAALNLVHIRYQCTASVDSTRGPERAYDAFVLLGECPNLSVLVIRRNSDNPRTGDRFVPLHEDYPGVWALRGIRNLRRLQFEGYKPVTRELRKILQRELKRKTRRTAREEQTVQARRWRERDSLEAGSDPQG
ncbi:MAG: hypothetical protein M1827_000793 [Pycnora praestabilis]|nr:MAG: hypothetical protein M1827_000793 [Pycnora praestabilis]